MASLSCEELHQVGSELLPAAHLVAGRQFRPQAFGEGGRGRRRHAGDDLGDQVVGLQKRLDRRQGEIDVTAVERGDPGAVDPGHGKAPGHRPAEQPLGHEGELIAGTDAEAVGQSAAEQQIFAADRENTGGHLVGDLRHPRFGCRIDAVKQDGGAFRPGEQHGRSLEPGAEGGHPLPPQHLHHFLRLRQRLESRHPWFKAGRMHLHGAGVEADGAGNHLLVQTDLQRLEDDDAEQAETDGGGGKQGAAGIAPHVAQRQPHLQPQGRSHGAASGSSRV